MGCPRCVAPKLRLGVCLAGFRSANARGRTGDGWQAELAETHSQAELGNDKKEEATLLGTLAGRQFLLWGLLPHPRWREV